MVSATSNANNGKLINCWDGIIYAIGVMGKIKIKELLKMRSKTRK
jgi:hypothetical protein